MAADTTTLSETTVERLKTSTVRTSMTSSLRTSHTSIAKTISMTISSTLVSSGIPFTLTSTNKDLNTVSSSPHTTNGETSEENSIRNAKTLQNATTALATDTSIPPSRTTIDEGTTSEGHSNLSEYQTRRRQSFQSVCSSSTKSIVSIYAHHVFQ